MYEYPGKKELVYRLNRILDKCLFQNIGWFFTEIKL